MTRDKLVADLMKYPNGAVQVKVLLDGCLGSIIAVSPMIEDPLSDDMTSILIEGELPPEQAGDPRFQRNRERGGKEI